MKADKEVLILLRHITDVTDQHMLMLACYYIKVSLVSMPALSGTSVSVPHQFLINEEMCSDSSRCCSVLLGAAPEFFPPHFMFVIL